MERSSSIAVYVHKCTVCIIRLHLKNPRALGDPRVSARIAATFSLPTKLLEAVDRNSPMSRTALCGRAALFTAAAAGAYLPFVEKNPNKKNERSEMLLSDTPAQPW